MTADPRDEFSADPADTGLPTGGTWSGEPTDEVMERLDETAAKAAQDAAAKLCNLEGHEWVQIASFGGPPAAICERCGAQLPAL